MKGYDKSSCHKNVKVLVLCVMGGRVCREVRQNARIVIVLFAIKDVTTDKVKPLNAVTRKIMPSIGETAVTVRPP